MKIQLTHGQVIERDVVTNDYWLGHDGILATLDGDQLGLFVWQKRVMFLLNGRGYEMGEVKVENELLDEDTRRMTVRKGDEVLLSKQYPREKYFDIGLHWTLDEEDSDRLLWFAHIWSSPERQQIVLETREEPEEPDDAEERPGL
jgi:hypothetical protein